MFKYKLVIFAFLFSILFTSNAYCDVLWTDTSPMTVFLSKHYKVDPIVVISLGQRMSKYDDDVSTAIYLAKLANVDPMKMLDPRLEGKSWGYIMRQYKIDPINLFTTLPAKAVIPGKFSYDYGQLERRQKNSNYEMVIYDSGIRNLIQLKLLKEGMGMEPLTVMNKVSQGYTFTDLILNKNDNKVEPTVEE
jgi:hypothetical protein